MMFIDASSGELLPNEPILGLRFLGARAVQPILELREALAILGVANPRFEDALELAELSGHYELEDDLAGSLRQKGLALGVNGKVPYTAPLDFLTREMFLLAEKPAWRVDEIESYFLREGLEPVDLHRGAACERSFQIALHVGGRTPNFWQILSAFDALEFHRSPWIEIIARRKTL